jgi:oligosaccharyltransferase complex subunit alpha (ribophorin I)
MKPFAITTALFSFVSFALAGATTDSKTSKVILPVDFKPPQVFKNANLVHVISLEKTYVKEQINVLVENVAKEPQTEYYVPFTAEQLPRIGGFEVKDRKDANAGPFVAETVEYNSLRYVSSSLTMSQFNTNGCNIVMFSTIVSDCPRRSSLVLNKHSESPIIT